MKVGQAYTFHVKRKGTSRLQTYEGILLRREGDQLVFDNLGSAGSTIRVEESAITEHDELHIDLDALG